MFKIASVGRISVLVPGVIAAAMVWKETQTEATINHAQGMKNEKLIR
jgi:nitrate reductase NapAB chaperone NapD